jgi:hypothetical protein
MEIIVSPMFVFPVNVVEFFDRLMLLCCQAMVSWTQCCTHREDNGLWNFQVLKEILRERLDYAIDSVVPIHVSGNQHKMIEDALEIASQQREQYPLLRRALQYRETWLLQVMHFKSTGNQRLEPKQQQQPSTLEPQASKQPPQSEFLLAKSTDSLEDIRSMLERLITIVQTKIEKEPASDEKEKVDGQADAVQQLQAALKQLTGGLIPVSNPPTAASAAKPKLSTFLSLCLVVSFPCAHHEGAGKDEMKKKIERLKSKVQI